MIKAIDVLILVVYDMFEGCVYYLIITKDNIPLSDQTNLGESLGTLNLDAVSEELRDVVQDLDSIAEFPYEAFRSASNPKVLSLIID